MKIVTKLLFTALLIGVALNLPPKVHASGGYTCNWSNYGQCYGNLQSWMDTCAEGCTADGSGNNTYCYNTTYTYYIDGNLYTSTYQNCDTLNNTSCMQNCVNDYNDQLTVCIEDNCTPV
jgi:hypothetical protein